MADFLLRKRRYEARLTSKTESGERWIRSNRETYLADGNGDLFFEVPLDIAEDLQIHIERDGLIVDVTN